MKCLILILIFLTGCAGVYRPYQYEYYPYRSIVTPYNPYQGYYGPNYGVIQPYRSYPRFHHMR